MGVMILAGLTAAVGALLTVASRDPAFVTAAGRVMRSPIKALMGRTAPIASAAPPQQVAPLRLVRLPEDGAPTSRSSAA